MNERVALVTGGTSGIGRAVALALAEVGSRVVVAARGRRRGMAVVRAVELEGGEAYFIPTDVSRAEEVDALVEQILDLYGALHYAVNAAAVTDPVLARTAELTEEEFDEMVAVTLRGAWLCMRREIPAIVASGGGAIVNIASINGVHGTPGPAHYAAANHAVVGLSKTAAVEYGDRGIRVNCVCPGPTDTPMLRRTFEVLGKDVPGGAEAVEERYTTLTSSGRVGRPSEVARAVRWLCSSEASYVNGAVLTVDGGLAAGPAGFV